MNEVMNGTPTAFQKYDGFKDLADMHSEFRVPVEERITDEQVIVAAYLQESYEGFAWVVFKGTDGKLYEVSGGHCSYYGLEDQWTPEETSIEAILLRPSTGSYMTAGLTRTQIELALTAAGLGIPEVAAQ